MAVSFIFAQDSQFLASWQYLANWVLAVILGLAFVFYFARLVGYVLSLILNIFLWKKGHVWISIGAFRVSPLGGRIMARNVVISTADYTVLILRLNLTWRYWLFKMTRLPLYAFGLKAKARFHNTSGLTAEQNQKLPAGLLLHIDGLEVFIYNRTAAYDNIEETLKNHQNLGSDSLLQSPLSPKLSQNSGSDSLASSLSLENIPQTKSSTLKLLLLVLPLQVTIKRGAFVVGNHTTPSILVGSFRTAKAVVDVGSAASNLDLYRTILDLNMDRFQVHMKPNITYDPERYTSGPRKSFKHKAATAVKQTLRKQTMLDMLSHLRFKRRQKKHRNKDGGYEWHGLRRYVGEPSTDRVVELTDIEEYAKYSLILDSVATQIVYYYDTPGVQPSKTLAATLSEVCPQTGVDIHLSMATVHYGSWADRQRGALQALLFPGLARDSEPTPARNKRGSIRDYEGFSVQVFAKNELILRVPTREFSKDKEELAARDDQKQKNTRPFGWLELKLAKGSEVKYYSSYMATSHGWANSLEVNMADLEVRSSVTHGILFTADKHTAKADIGFPLSWNGECTWTFDIASTGGRFFFLREHITLFIDMIADFGSGPPPNFENFRPFTYLLNWSIHDFLLFFNVNDHNIINDPLDFDSNKYICFSGNMMDVKLKIPLRGMFAATSTVEYEISAPLLDLTLEVPPWHTVCTFSNGCKKMGSTGAFEISGQYTYYSKAEVDHNNFAAINITGDDITLLFHGYLVRYLFTFRENYFGDFINFKTSEEYILSEGVDSKDLESGSIRTSISEKKAEYWKLVKAENDLNIQFTFKARKGKIILPCQIYDFSHNISLCFDFVDVDIHMCQFYMDLQADFSTAKGYHISADKLPSREIVFETLGYNNVLSTMENVITIGAFSVHTHRMLGIDDLTYHCKWDFACDLIEIDGSPAIISSLDTGLSNFVLGYKDLENSLTYQVPVVYDAANFTFRCPEIRLRLSVGIPHTYIVAEVKDILVSFNDIANLRYSSRISVLIPYISVKVIDDTEEAKYTAFLETSLHLTNFCEKLKMTEHREMQHEHIRRNDATTHRTAFLLDPEEKTGMFQEAKGAVFSTVSLPLASSPLTEEVMTFGSESESQTESHLSLDVSSDYLDVSSVLNGEMFPTTHYNDDDFRPIPKPDEQFKKDSFVLKFEPVNACICPQGIHALTALMSSDEGVEIDTLLDRLQCEIMKELKHLILPIPMIDNLRVVSPFIDIRIVEQSISTPKSLFTTYHLVPAIILSICEPSIVLQKQHSRVRLGAYLEEQVSIALASHVSEIYAAVSLPGSFSSALSVHASDLEVWMTKNEVNSLVISVSLNALKVNVHGCLLENALKFVNTLIEDTKASISKLKQAKEESKGWKKDLIYFLCKYAAINKILSDPEVITKPARLLRTKREHVRFYEAWRIMTKLRSIAREVDPSEASQFNLSDEFYRAPEDAVNFVTESFRAWRTWEGNMKQRENFLRDIYVESKVFSGGLKALLDVAHIELNLMDQDDISDHMVFRDISVQVAKLPDHHLSDVETSNASVPSAVDVAVNINAIDMAFTTCILSLANSLKRITTSPVSEPVRPKSEAKSETKSETKPSGKMVSVSVVTNLNSFTCRFSLPKSYLEMSCDHITSSMIAVVLPTDLVQLGWALNLGQFGLVLGNNRHKFLDFSSRQTTVIASGTKEGPNLDVVVEQDSKDVDLRILDEEASLVPAISDFLEEDLKVVLDVFDGSEQKQAVKVVPEKKVSATSFIPSVTLNVGFEKILYLIDAFDPLKLHGVLTGARTKLFLSDTKTFGEYLHKAFTIELGVRETSVIHAKSSEFYISSALADFGTSWLVKADIESEYFKVTTPLLLNAFDSVLKHSLPIVEKFESLKKVAAKSPLMAKKDQRGSSLPGEDFSLSRERKKLIYFKVGFTQKYCGWFTYKDHSRFTLELDETKITAGNTAGVNGHKITGEVLMPATRVTIYDPLFSVGLSTLLDYHISVKLLNDSASDGSILGQSLQVESEHFRVCLCPQTIFKMYELAESLKHKYEQYDGFAGVKPKEVQPSLPPITKSKPKQAMFTSIHVLSYNFCIGWLFGAAHKDYPGLILGAERIFAVTKADMGKLTVVDGYLSVANGSSSSSFFSSSSEFDNLNRAFMPKLQLNYYVDKARKLWVTLKGDELDVRSMSNSTVLIERAMRSGTQMREYFEEKSKRADLRKQNTQDLRLAPKPKTEPAKKTFEPPFEAVQFIVGFAGARIFLYKLLEDNLNEEPNSLALQSPAIRIVLDYVHKKNVSRHHVVKAEVLMCQSDNTVHASCVPVVEDFVRTFKDMFATPHKPPADVSRTSQKESKPSNLSEEFGSVFSRADIHVGVRIEKQRVSLSCEPTAKVAAIVEYDGASILACSGMEAFDSIYVLGHMKAISASLQHIYSDERSGSLTINSSVLSSMIAFKKDLEVVSSCSISDISGYVKMKQYQDVDLFRDIWFPKSYEVNVRDVAREEVPTKEVQPHATADSSSVSRLSVALDVIFSNIMLEVDFGPALGTLILDIDKAWAVSRKVSTWSYEFKVGLQTLLVRCEGRLGGYLKLGGLFLNSSIEWKLDDLPLLEVPLVHMAAGFGEFQFKTIFDEHVFAFANLKGWRVDVYNRKDGANVSKDHLFVSIRYDSTEAFLTSLAASDFYDINETISRMIEEKRTSYKEILKDSNKESFMNRACSNDFLEVARKLDTQIEVFTGLTTIQVYPHSFQDSKVLVVQLDRSTANFVQNEYEFGVSNQIELQLNNVKASFSSTAGATKEDIQDFDVDALSQYASKAKGGTILGFPRFMISMRTYQKFQTNIVEYLFQSSFGGTVDVRWNLGLVNCVREMYSAHKRALLSRTEMARNEASAFQGDRGLNEISLGDSEAPEELQTGSAQITELMLSSSETPHKDFDKDIQHTMEKVTNRSKFVYKALAPAIIEAPRLKELGNATPPLEWFGLHRNKFPDATHQLAIVTLQKLIHEIELEYSKMLGTSTA